jgi:hypothetical protein
MCKDSLYRRSFSSDYKPLMVDYTPVENQQGAAQSRLVLSPPASPPTSTRDQATGTSYSPGWCSLHLPVLPPPPWTMQQVHPTVQAGALSTCQPSHLHPGPGNRYILQSRLVLSLPASPPTYTREQATGTSYSPGWCSLPLPSLPPPPWTMQQVHPTVQAGALSTCQPSHLHPGLRYNRSYTPVLVLFAPASVPWEKIVMLTLILHI